MRDALNDLLDTCLSCDELNSIYLVTHCLASSGYAKFILKDPFCKPTVLQVTSSKGSMDAGCAIGCLDTPARPVVADFKGLLLYGEG